jgi:hypothetical protein
MRHSKYATQVQLEMRGNSPTMHKGLQADTLTVTSDGHRTQPPMRDNSCMEGATARKSGLPCMSSLHVCCVSTMTKQLRFALRMPARPNLGMKKYVLQPSSVWRSVETSDWKQAAFGHGLSGPVQQLGHSLSCTAGGPAPLYTWQQPAPGRY